MPSRVLLTIDTELTWRHHRPGQSWHDNFARSYEAAGVGIPFQLEILSRHGLKACFFVDPMPALLFGPEPVERMVQPILAAGQEVQLHLHPFWLDLASGADTVRFELTDFDAAGQERLIATARDLLVRAGAPKPIAFRAGSYAADANTLAALARLGFRFDSSHNGSHNPWPSALPIPPERIAPLTTGGLTEVPVTQIEEAPARLRHLQICAVSFQELRAALLHADRRNHSLVTIVSHSFELATRNGQRVNGVVRARFERLCRFLAARRETLPTLWCQDLDTVAATGDARPLAGAPVRRYHRLVSQAWGTARYERPGEMLTASSGTALTGVEALLPYVG